MLLYIIEAVIPVLTFQLVWAGKLAWRQEKERHKKVAAIHAASLWGSYLLVWILIMFGQTLQGNAPRWIVDTHLVIIYIIPALLIFMMATGLRGARKAHMALAGVYVLLWGAALVTGAMIFLAHRGYI
ncbi:MAG: hypothetical protein OEY50_01995 [Nitrospinota bacterium]|nr:hypothetical protein [Nitrospinota bacterium]MDH5679392.1 hypothetical protein [Nitrospinota bacterium]MDH5756581.1 hypothetical protein [Nitrospinota bacterium]